MYFLKLSFFFFFSETGGTKMNRQRVDSQGSLGPNDEVMPYSDDETDEELDETSESEEEGPPQAPHPPVEPRHPGLSLFIQILSVFKM